ncbi:conserved hypothetical protein [Frankia canadensis]|uniref:Limonene-1,2-epoxide hydrolase domain-containing protein n=1 Tax=Frankia canadensis TaxID=1836972 RepID=A0A2I2KHZ7_9ACTN|nr:limonene-1,2-epoxide hydrolase family protein [Frankia canadensis]SNQ45291.1 conserved hypothetical protein [Frankia canadensis]SOU52581.1 conserved hypothetical protein [Frankia canadensis]
MGAAGDVVRKFCAAFASLDASNLRPFLTPETVFENVPLTGQFHRAVGVNEIVSRMQSKLSICVETDFKILSLIEDGGVVFAERSDYFRFPAGTFPTIDAHEWLVCSRWDVADGKIALWRDYYDVTSSLSALGVSWQEYRTYLERARAALA